jgi:hydrogenase-4 component B
MTPLGLLGISCLTLAVSGIVAIPRRSPAHLSTAILLIGCVIGILGAAFSLSAGTTAVHYRWYIPSGAIAIVVDPLAAFFLFPVFVVGGLGALYGEGYWSVSEHPTTGRKLRCFYGVLIAGLVLVMIAGDAWSFLFGWEIVGVAAFFLVTTVHEPDALRAGWIYLIAAHTGTLALFAMFGLLHNSTGTWELTRSSALAHSHLLVPILLLALVGFGIKAGVMPFHIWLPEAHAAAPSHVSAILSAVVLKMGIYGLVRILSMITAYPQWLGTVLLALGIVSGLLGVTFALAQHDLKRLLAYHSIENIGIILMGLGIGTLGAATGHPALAVLGFAGGLLHVWNHAAFKALLFYAAGAVVHATGTRHIDALGGLLRSMRVTGIAFLVGAVAICGLPPLNGFVSEWLLYLAGFRALLDGTSVALLASLAAPVLALIGALAVACFVKAFTVVFLGKPRTEIGSAHDATLSMQVPMIVLGILCVFIGLWPTGAGAVASRATNMLTGGLSGPAVANALAPLTPIATLLLLVVLVTALLVKTLIPTRRGVVTWDCGYAQPTSRMQYTASSFAQQLVRLFSWVLLPITPAAPPHSIFPSLQKFQTHVPDPVLDRVVLPGVRRTKRVLEGARIIQVGHVQAYLVYIVVTLIVLLAWSSM